MKYELELTDECVGNIVRQDLKCIYELMAEDLERVSKSKMGFVFSTNKKEDMGKIKTMMNALKLVMAYYGKD